ncbi:NAD(P)-binding protein [Ramaria rubella]|nr:NAD(P)-binding protein [Ramaria rubella]
MPHILPPAKILVTGGTGFIGSWVIRKLLDRQYEDGAFDEALDGIHGVQHIASPLTGDPDELVNAAVNGTLSILRSIVKQGAGVRRMVLTSSAAALMEPKPYPCVYTEDDWNLSAPKALENTDATPTQKYYASKTLAEQAAWEFVEGKKFDLVTILPSLVFHAVRGIFFRIDWKPIIHQVECHEKLSYSLMQFYDGIRHEKTLGATFGNWVDVRDVAESHVLTMEREEASGERFITCADAASWQLIYDTINSTTPLLCNLPQGQPGDVDQGMPQWRFQSNKIQQLGLVYKTLAESARDCVVSMREHGWQ